MKNLYYFSNEIEDIVEEIEERGGQIEEVHPFFILKIKK